MRLRYAIWFPILIAAMCCPVLAAGQQDGASNQASQTATSGQTESASQGAETSETPTTEPDARSFLGAEAFSPGRVGQMRNYFLPSFQFSERTDSNYPVGGGRQSFETINSVMGRLAFGRFGRHSTLSADYMGGGQFYNYQSDRNTTMHQFGISASYRGQRWSFLLDDRASYLPESSFGYGGFGWSGSLGSSLGGALGSNLGNLNPYYGASGSLLTGRGARIHNTTAMQVQYLVGPRTSISISGSYGLLHFREAGFIDSTNSYFFTGLSHQLTGRDYIGFGYGFGLFQFKSTVPSFQTHYLQLSYGHRINGRMSVDLGGGAQVGVYQNPLMGSTTPISWTANSSLNYRFRRGSLAVYYARYTSSGGGVLTGANTDSLQVSWGTGLTRMWSVSLGPGYSHNRSIPQTTLGATGRSFDTAYAYTSLSRSLGRYMDMFITYNFQTQRSETLPCLTGDCTSSLLRHLIGFGFSWHPRQIVFE